MIRGMFALAVLCLALPGWAGAAVTAESIIDKVDENQTFDTEAFEATMVIRKGDRTLTKTFYGYGRWEGKTSFMAFTNPEDRGVKYLKRDDELWIYFPDADDVMKISGHMLRQGMMGSDISYEDMLEEESLEETYASRRLEDEVVDGRPCYVVELTAKKPDVAYAKQRLAVDRTWYIPLRLELYARGGRKLKEMTQEDVERVGDRWVPRKVTIRDLRRRDSETVVTFDEIAFDVAVPDRVFTLGYLQR